MAHDPNIAIVFSPDGEGPFEVTRINGIDLTQHAGWTYAPKGTTVSKAEPAPAPAPTPTPAPAPAPAPVTPPPAAEPEVEDEEAETEAEETTEDEAETPFTTEEQFAELTDRDALVAYLAKHFPSYKPHHLAGRDKLVEKAIELAAK